MSERIEMTSTENSIEPKAERAPWQRPEVSRVGMRDAEADINANTDGSILT